MGAPTYRKNSWQEALRQCGFGDDEILARELGETFIRERRKRHIVYDDVLPTLEHFRQRCRLGLLTNGAPDLQRAKLEGSGLGIFFDAIVVLGEVGYGKPDPRIFKLVLARLNAKPEAAVMVGNSLKSDVSPAKEIGMIAVWVNREGRVGDKFIVPNAEVADLTKLKDIFEQDFARDGLKPRP